MEPLSAVFFVGQVLEDAAATGCTDVHLAADAHKLQVELRLNGLLQPYIEIPGDHTAVIRRVKALANIDVAETRLPQDGAFRWATSESGTLHVRVATMPTVRGESVALRLLRTPNERMSFEELGMTADQASQVNQLLNSEHGLILLAGPTGTGKTTTLYAMMHHVANLSKRVVSIEDPVELILDNCHQLEVREQTGFNFRTGVRALLRHDPDVMVIGEIRDEATARMALRASLSGHLVLTTTHAVDPVAAAARLCEFDVARSSIAEALRGVIVLTRFSDRVGQPSHSRQHHHYEVHLISPELSGWIASDIPWHDVRRRYNEMTL